MFKDQKTYIVNIALIERCNAIIPIRNSCEFFEEADFKNHMELQDLYN
jgi:hypothetical protein